MTTRRNDLPPAKAIVDSELLALQVYQLLDERYPVPEILSEIVFELVKITVDCTLEVLTESLGIGHRIPPNT